MATLSAAVTRRSYACGIACICFVAVVWTLATVLKQIIFSDLKFDEPLILTYVCNACYAVHFPIHALLRLTGLAQPIPWRRVPKRDDAPGGGEMREAMVAGLIIAPLWFFAQWTYAAGVASTSVTASTVISTTSVVWTLLGSIVFLKEKVTALKVLGILLCMAGNAATLLGNDTQSSQKGELVGDLLCLVAAILYAVYTTVLSSLVQPQFSMAMLFGIIGISILLVGSPFVFAFKQDALKQMTPEVFGLLIFNGLFDNVLSQFAWAKAVQWTSPTTATVGLSLTIPLSVVADLLRHKYLTWWTLVAALLVIFGFLSVTCASKPSNEQPASAPPLEETLAVEASDTRRV